MKRKESWKKAVLILGITLVGSGMGGKGIAPVSVYADPEYNPLEEDIKIPSEDHNEIKELVDEYLDEEKDRKKKKIAKKLRKKDEDMIKQWLFNYAIDECDYNLKNTAKIAELYEMVYPDDECQDVWENVSDFCQQGISYDDQIRTVQRKYDSNSIEVNTGTFYISNKLETQYEDGLEGSINKLADYLEPDNMLAYAGYDPSGIECVILTEKAFEYGGNQEIAYSYDGKKRTVSTTDGFEREVPVYVQVDMSTMNQRNQDAANVDDMKGKLKWIEYSIRYKLEGKTTSEVFEGNYIFPASSKRELTDEDLELSEISAEMIQIGINEIYARHGRIFSDPSWAAYFEGKNWYKGIVQPDEFDENIFSQTEKDNINFLEVMYELYGGNSITETDSENISYVINCEESITLWEKPDISSAELCQIPLGTAVNVLQGAPNGFVQVDYEGMTGFCLGSYLSEIQ